MNVLFVCTGNTCRSPMAQAMAAQHFAGAGIEALAASCGVHAWDGAPASFGAVGAMEAVGLDLAGHSAKSVTFELMEGADVVITMTAGHKAHLLAGFGEFADKIHAMADLCAAAGDIGDPFGGDASLYAACAADILRCIESIDWRGFYDCPGV